MSLREGGLVSFRLTSNRFGDFSGAGGSTGLERKASEESTQSPTEDEMVAARMEKTVKLIFTVFELNLNEFILVNSSLLLLLLLFS